MGERGNICVVQHGYERPPSCIFIYTHWGWEDLPMTLQAALKRDDSDWECECHLTRVIIDEVSKTDESTGEVGVSTYLTDNDHPILVVNAKKQTVAVSPSRRNEHAVFGPLLHETSFEKFVAMTDAKLRAFRSRRGVR